MPRNTNRAKPGEEAQAAARLDAAHEGERRAQARQDDARGAPAELAAATDLLEAQEQVAAREAWMQWIQRDY
jgi:hypothetical protein